MAFRTGEKIFLRPLRRAEAGEFLFFWEPLEETVISDSSSDRGCGEGCGLDASARRSFSFFLFLISIAEFSRRLSSLSMEAISVTLSESVCVLEA